MSPRPYPPSADEGVTASTYTCVGTGYAMVTR